MGVKMWIAQERARDLLTDIPANVDVEVYDGTAYPSDPADVEFMVPPFLGSTQEDPLKAFPSLKVVQLLSAGADAWATKMKPGVTLCDGQGVHTESTAEWAVTAVLASLRQFDVFARAQARREWQPAKSTRVAGQRVLIVGAGDIGEAIAARLEPFGVELVRVARRSREGVHPISNVNQLLPDADVVVLIVPLTDATRKMVDANFLHHMKDGALLVNAARGPVVDTEALTHEVTSGRLRCAVDVTDPEPLPADHPLWEQPGALITPHVGGAVNGFLPRGYQLVSDQVRRYCAGKELNNIVTDGY